MSIPYQKFSKKKHITFVYRFPLHRTHLFCEPGLLQCYKVSVFDHLQDLLPQPKYIPVEPSHGLYFWRSTSSKQGRNSNQNKGHLGSRYMCTMYLYIYIHMCQGRSTQLLLKRGYIYPTFFWKESGINVFVLTPTIGLMRLSPVIWK